MNTTIIIVAYNALQWIDHCLQSTADYPVVVVDNASSDQTVAHIQGNFSKVNILPQAANLGFGQANNIGISYALGKGAEYVFLLNQDAYLEDGSLEKLIKVSKKSPQYGILSPIHLNGKGDRLDKKFTYYLRYEANEDFFSDYVLGKVLQPFYEVPFVNAAGWLISKNCLLQIGGFDPIFFHYGEDTNFCQRIKYHGYKIGVVPEAFLKHDREEQDNFESFFKKKNLEKMEWHYKTKYANINEENLNDFKRILETKKTAQLKSILKFKFRLFFLYQKERRLLKRIFNEVEISRSINKIKSTNYLNIYK